MYSLCVRDHFMIAHSFQGEIFGPAQQLHGATYVVDVELMRSELDADGLVADIGLAASALKSVLSAYNYSNLDDAAEFNGRNTTTEFLAKAVFSLMAREIRDGKLGSNAAGIERMRVTLRESHIAWAAFEGKLDSPSG